MDIKQLLRSTSVALLVAAPLSLSAAPILSDIVTIVDESGSMGGEHAWLGGMISNLDVAILDATGQATSNAQFGLTGYGRLSGADQSAEKYYMDSGSEWGSAEEFNSATSQLNAYGGTEDGWEAIEYVNNNYTFREDASKSLILITDEDRDNAFTNSNYSQILDLLIQNDYTLNVIVNANYQCEDGTAASGVDNDGIGFVIGANGYEKCQNATATWGAGSTLPDYIDLAWATGGSAWRLHDLRSGSAAFAAGFTAAFVAETTDDVVSEDIPEPGTLSIIALGMLGLFSRRIKKA